MNLVKTAMLLAAMTALFMGIGFMIGGQQGMLIALLIAAAMNLWSWWNSGNAVLRMHNAVEIDRANAPEFYRVVEALAERAGLPMPRVFLIDSKQPNAFATGRGPENAAVAATTGLLELMSEEEVAAVMAHELAHVENRDTLIMTVTATLAAAISMLGNFAFFFGGNRNNPLGGLGVLLAMIVAPIAAGIVQMAISRTREYSADRRGAEICGQPLWLASALKRIAVAAGRIPNMAAERAPSTAHMFIINPLNGDRADNLFSTHPATENRVAALEELARSPDFVPAGAARRIEEDRVERRVEGVRPARSPVPPITRGRRSADEPTTDEAPMAGPWDTPEREPVERGPMPGRAQDHPKVDARPKRPTSVPPVPPRWGRGA